MSKLISLVFGLILLVLGVVVLVKAPSDSVQELKGMLLLIISTLMFQDSLV